MKIESAARSYVGRRPRNEDALCANESLGLYAVADGMGGYAGGEVASRLVVETLERFVRDNARDDNVTWPLPLDPTLGPSENLVSVGVRLANAVVRSQRAGKLASMGSTVAATLVRDDRAVIAHVGDSRVYRLREGVLSQVTRDHSLYAEMVAMGMNVPPLEQFPHRNVITRALGMNGDVKVDVETERLRPGDVLLLCTDGLVETVSDDRIAAVLSTHDPQHAVDTLVDEAFAGGGHDNITAIVLRAESHG